jgi:hypothetical protein
MDDRLSFILRTPSVVESVVREALREALAARRLRDDPPDVRTFCNLALLALERRTRGTSARTDRTSETARTDPVGRHELEAATLRAAACFASSSLARRLFRIPPERLAPGPRGADLTVRDARGRRHLVRLETFRTPDERLAALDAAAKSAASHPLREPPAIHFFSLLDGTFRSYPSTARAITPGNPRVRRVA